MMEEAARVLSDIFIKGNVDSSHFSIGIGSDRLHAYMRCSRKQWRGPRPPSCNGIPIDWHWNVGPTVAYAMQTGD